MYVACMRRLNDLVGPFYIVRQHQVLSRGSVGITFKHTQAQTYTSIAVK